MVYITNAQFGISWTLLPKNPQHVQGASTESRNALSRSQDLSYQGEVFQKTYAPPGPTFPFPRYGQRPVKCVETNPTLYPVRHGATPAHR